MATISGRCQKKCPLLALSGLVVPPADARFRGKADVANRRAQLRHDRNCDFGYGDDSAAREGPLQAELLQITATVIEDQLCELC